MQGNSIEYRDVPGFPGYRVGSNGSVWSQWRTCIKGRFLANWHQLKTPNQKNRSPGRSYLRVNLLHAEGRMVTFRVHRLILECFVGPCPEGMQCRHLNGNPADNRIENLAWGTPEENHSDCRKHGRYTETERNQIFTHDGRTLCLKDWARLLGLSYNALWQRIFTLHWSFSDAISKPFRAKTLN